MSELRKKQTILVVDDTVENIDLLVGILEADYEVKVAINGERALKIANSPSKPDLILLDIMMPGMDGYEVCRLLKCNIITKHIPVIFLTAMNDIDSERKGFEIGAVDFITKPISPPIVLARIKTHLFIYDQKRALEDMVDQRTAELNETRLEIIKHLGRAAEYKDNDTGLHVIRLSLYSKILAEGLGLNKKDIELIYHAAAMHDIGKIGIPDNILKKPAKLNEEEWNLMKQHSEFGGEIIGNPSSELLSTAKVIALTHHEKWDGTGYPLGLKGQDIPLVGRIAAVADVYDALINKRPYKNAWEVEEAISIIRESSGTHFDPDIVEVFMKSLQEIKGIQEKYYENI